MPEATLSRLSCLLVCLAALAGPRAPAQFPDLTVTDIDVFPANPAPGEEITVTVTAANIGNALPFEPVFMYLYHDSALQPAPCAHNQLQLLKLLFPSGSERIFTFTVEYPTAGVHRLWAWIDGCEPQVDEWEENNNWLSRDITVGFGDLSIIGMEPSVVDPVPGQSFMLNVFVRNSGPAIIDQVWWIGLSLQAAEPQFCGFEHNRGPFLGFPPNAVTTLQFGPFEFPANGSYPAWAWIDCEDNVVEADETNNKRMDNIVIGLPDLIVESISPSVVTPNVNQPFDVQVVIRNVGSRPAVSFLAALVPDSATQPGDSSACESAIYQYMPSLEPEASATVTFSVTYSEARQHRLWAFADPCGGIPEPREDNNQLSRDINVGSGIPHRPDLVVESISTSTLPAQFYGDIVTFDVTVRNVGGVTTGPFRVGDFALPEFPGLFPSVFVSYGPPGPHQGSGAILVSGWPDCELRTREVPGLAPGAAATVQFWRHYSQAGVYRFVATADACGEPLDRTVYEGSEANNELAIDFEAFVCDSDRDTDGICDLQDRCPDTFDPLNNDSDNDGAGDACESDDDNDGWDDNVDCDPRNPFVHPGTREDCTDGIDNNCDGQVDEGARTLYRDADGDGFGDRSSVVTDCTRAGYVTNRDDCNDFDAAIHPGANGRCDDGLDNDCDGLSDNERSIWGRDADGDGFSDPNDIIVDGDGICDGQPEGYVLVSQTADPDDADFMVPEPVVLTPNAVAISRAQSGRIDPAFVELQRRGPQVYRFSTQITYGPEADGWLTALPASGEAVDGLARIALTPDTSSLPRARYSASLRVTVNEGAASFEVPIDLTVRNPILRVEHSGSGAGYVYAWYHDNAAGNDVGIGDGFSNGGIIFEGEVPLGEGFYLYAAADDCSTFIGFGDESNQLLNSNPETGQWGPYGIEGDRTITARFTPDYLQCASCGFILVGLSLTGLWFTRRGPRMGV